jgi:hypothetical protein
MEVRKLNAETYSFQQMVIGQPDIHSQRTSLETYPNLAMSHHIQNLTQNALQA